MYTPHVGNYKYSVIDSKYMKFYTLSTRIARTLILVGRRSLYTWRCPICPSGLRCPSRLVYSIRDILCAEFAFVDDDF